MARGKLTGRGLKPRQPPRPEIIPEEASEVEGTAEDNQDVAETVSAEDKKEL
jgi:hypothetical protein